MYGLTVYASATRAGIAWEQHRPQNNDITTIWNNWNFSRPGSKKIVFLLLHDSRDHSTRATPLGRFHGQTSGEWTSENHEWASFCRFLVFLKSCYSIYLLSAFVEPRIPAYHSHSAAVPLSRRYFRRLRGLITPLSCSYRQVHCAA